MPREHGRRLAELYPQGRLTEIADSSTLIPEDQPERLAEVLIDFLVRTGAERSRSDALTELRCRRPPAPCCGRACVMTCSRRPPELGLRVPADSRLRTGAACRLVRGADGTVRWSSGSRPGRLPRAFLSAETTCTPEVTAQRRTAHTGRCCGRGHRPRGARRERGRRCPGPAFIGLSAAGSTAMRWAGRARARRPRRLRSGGTARAGPPCHGRRRIPDRSARPSRPGRHPRDRSRSPVLLRSPPLSPPGSLGAGTRTGPAGIPGRLPAVENVQEDVGPSWKGLQPAAPVPYLDMPRLTR